MTELWPAGNMVMAQSEYFEQMVKRLRGKERDIKSTIGIFQFI